MANKKFWLGMLVMVLVFGMTVIGCDDGNGSGNGNGSYELDGTSWRHNRYDVDWGSVTETLRFVSHYCLYTRTDKYDTKTSVFDEYYIISGDTLIIPGFGHGTLSESSILIGANTYMKQ